MASIKAKHAWSATNPLQNRCLAATIISLDVARQLERAH